MQDGWADTPYVKKASKKTPPKGCPGNGGDAHYYVVEKIITISKEGEEDTSLMYPHCLLCNHRAGRKVTRGRDSLEVVETKVYLQESFMRVRFGLSKVKPTSYPGNTDSKGRLLF